MKDGMIVRELQQRLLCPKWCNIHDGTVKYFLLHFTQILMHLKYYETLKLGFRYLLILLWYIALIVRNKNSYHYDFLDVLMVYLLGVKWRSHLNFFVSPSNTTALSNQEQLHVMGCSNINYRWNEYEIVSRCLTHPVDDRVINTHQHRKNFLLN